MADKPDTPKSFEGQIKALCKRHGLSHLDVSYHASTGTFYSSARSAGAEQSNGDGYFGHGSSDISASAAINVSIREVLSQRGPNLVSSLAVMAEAA